MSDRMQVTSHRSTLTGELYGDGKNWISFENDITELTSRSAARQLRRESDGETIAVTV